MRQVPGATTIPSFGGMVVQRPRAYGEGTAIRPEFRMVVASEAGRRVVEFGLLSARSLSGVVDGFCRMVHELYGVVFRVCGVVERFCERRDHGYPPFPPVIRPNRPPQ